MIGCNWQCNYYSSQCFPIPLIVADLADGGGDDDQDDDDEKIIFQLYVSHIILRVIHIHMCVPYLSRSLSLPRFSGYMLMLQ